MVTLMLFNKNKHFYSYRVFVSLWIKVQLRLLPLDTKISHYLASQLHFSIQNSGELGTNFCSKSQINIRNWPILVKPIKMGTPYCSPGIGDWGKPRGPHSRGWGMQTLVLTIPIDWTTAPSKKSLDEAFKHLPKKGLSFVGIDIFMCRLSDTFQPFYCP